MEIKNARIIHKNGKEENWNKVLDFIPYKGEIIIYNPDENHDTPRIKIGDGKSLPKDLPFYATITQDDLKNIVLSHSLTIGDKVFNGSEDVTIASYRGDYNIT